MELTVAEITLAIIIGTLAAIVYSLRILVQWKEGLHELSFISRE